MKLDYTPHNMADVEVKIVTKLFEMLEEEGVWVAVQTADGGDDLVPTTTWSEALETIDSVEWSTLQIYKDGRYAWVEFVLGNGVDVISNYSCRYQDFEALMERHAAWVETLED